MVLFVAIVVRLLWMSWVFVFEFESIKGLRAGSVLMQLLLLVLAIDAAFSAALDDEEDEEAEDDEVVVE